MLIFPIHIAQTSLQPDIVMYLNKTDQIILVELAILTNDNIIKRHFD